jgi:3-dehydroquinate synthase
LVRVTVEAPAGSYDVTIGHDVIERAAEHLPELPKAERAFVVADPQVAATWMGPLAAGLAERGLGSVHLSVPRGEAAKTLAVYEAMLHQLATQEAHRDDVAIALGGGAVGDLTGFLAGTYMRGIPFVQVPTTLTAQVDAAIGGKSAVNLPAGKNLVGVFSQPIAVLADVGPLATLPDRDFRSGLAEVAKYGLALDQDLLHLLEHDPAPLLARDPAVLEDVVARCVRVKARIVALDERDAGERLFLNYGHTLGHALERVEAFRERTHGEAISLGMVFASRLSVALGMSDAGIVGRTVRLLASLGLQTTGSMPEVDDVLAAFRMDKKYRGGVRFVLLHDVGRPVIADDVPEDAVRSILEEMGAT